ncbi:YybH family protein [Pandoraea capi]|nr:nuclear transport factor 2 family protein [Pandoraea capi]
MRQIRFCVAVLAASLSLSTFAAQTNAGRLQPQTESAIKVENARWAQAYARGDYQAIGQLYTKDGSLLPPGGDRIKGADAITEYFTKASGGSAPDTVSFSNYEFYGNDQVVTEVSDAEIHDPSGKLKYRGKQILIFLKQGGVWKLHRDLWNASAP